MTPSISFSAFTERFNLFLYQQNIRKLTEAERNLARDWSLALIRREHPELNEEQVLRFYDNLINVQIIAVDAWTQRMS